MESDTDSLRIVPIDKRQPWHVPAVIFGGLEFCIPVLLVGGILAANFGFGAIFAILAVALFVFQWIGNAFAGYVGARTGLTSTDLAALSFGREQARIFVGIVILIITLGWWAIQTTVATDALAVLVGVEKQSNYLLYGILMVVVGFLFAAPSILGYASIKWVDYIAMPAGLLLVFAALYLSFKNIGWETISTWSPEGGMSLIMGINLVISINVAQWLIAADYTRHAKPVWRDNILIPLGIIVVGFPLFLVGAVMSVGAGNANIVDVMQGLGFPAWGFVFLWIATWTSQLVSNYTGGLVLVNLFKTRGDAPRKKFTALFAVFGIVLGLLGIMSHFESFLYLTALIVPAVAGVIIAHFFLVSESTEEPVQAWNWRASVAVLVGGALGYLTQYVIPIGVPAIQTLLAAGVAHFILYRAEQNTMKSIPAEFRQWASSQVAVLNAKRE